MFLAGSAFVSCGLFCGVAAKPPTRVATRGSGPEMSTRASCGCSSVTIRWLTHADRPSSVQTMPCGDTNTPPSGVTARVAVSMMASAFARCSVTRAHFCLPVTASGRDSATEYGPLPHGISTVAASAPVTPSST